VRSVSDTTARVTERGGKILVPAHLDRHGGAVAVVADPAGAPFGLLEWNDADGPVAQK
jgi:predicted enzyme related to lactoylglutathione lyase